MLLPCYTGHSGPIQNCFVPSAGEPNPYSQDTVLLGEEEEEGEGEDPVISEVSIRQVVASSQSFQQERTDHALGQSSVHYSQLCGV